MNTIELNLNILKNNKSKIKAKLEAILGEELSDDMNTWEARLESFRLNRVRFLWNSNSHTMIVPLSSNTTIRKGIFAANRITKVTFNPEQNITAISERAFDNAYNLAEIVLPNVGWLNVQTIGTYAFYYCQKLGFFDFGDKVTSIGAYAFSSAGTNVKKLVVIFRATNPPTLGTLAFTPAKLTEGLYIYVPDDSVDAYKTATNWASWANYIHPLSEYNND